MNLFRSLIPERYSNQQWLYAIVIFIAYLVAAQVSMLLFTSPAVIVPSSGIALAGLVIGGLALWPAIYAAALFSLIINGSPALALLVFPFIQTLQPVAGAYLLKKLDFDPQLRRLRDMFAMIGIALSTSLIIPVLGSAVRYLTTSGLDSSSGLTLGTWWTGHILSLLIVAPFLIRWIAEPKFKRTIYQIIEIVAVLGILVAIDYLLGWTTFGQVSGISLIYFLLVPLFWLAIRIGPRFTILGMLLTSITLLVGAFYSHVPQFEEVDLGIRVFQLEIFINIIAVIFYIIAGLQEERTEAIKALRSYINRLEDALNRLSVQDRTKNEFIAVLAHELRNPLAPVVSSLELLRLNSSKTGEEAEAMELMDDRLKTIQRLLDDLLDVSRISRAKLRIRKEPIELRTIITHSVQSIDRLIKNRSQTLVLDIENTPVMLDADPVRLEQVVSNLLTNASKFTNEGGKIVITAKRDGDNALVSVRDNGIGIKEEMLDKIFEPFLQLETGERKGEGLGIGLSLTQRLVEMHNGTVTVRSEGVNRGSEFIVTIPVLQEYVEVSAPATQQPATPPTPPRSEDVKILVVDDNISAAHGIGKLLEYKGYTVAYAYTGSEAKEKVSSFSPTTVVLDIGLPDMDGYDLARMLRLGMGYQGRLIALTGYGQEEDKQRAYEAGFDHHLTKPVAVADLATLIV
jgi:signal transduction histidine kinase